ncbi:MAG: amidohydrolase family protein [Acidobacteria bacterium]|nr:amidohydrolase family protein [Acidobacteriota bacterium]
MKKFLVVLCVTLFFLGNTNAQQDIDLILYNAKVLTVDAQSSIAEAVAVSGKKIAAVGKSSDLLRLAGPNTLKVDLKGRTVIPGIVHTHSHVNQAAEANYGGEVGPEKLKMFPLNFRIVKTKEDLLKQIKDVVHAFQFHPGEWIYFSVTDLSAEHIKLLWEGITRWDLDQAAPSQPIMLSMGVPANSGYLTNSTGIEILWSKYGDFIEKYGRYWPDASGKPDGHLEPPAGRLAYPLLPAPDPRDLAPIYKKTLEELSAEGVTTASTRLADYSIAAYELLDSRGEMPVRLAYGFQSAFDTPDVSRWKDKKVGSGSETLWLNSVSGGMVDGAGFGWCTDLKRNDRAVDDPKAFGVLGLDQRNPMAEYYSRGWCHLDIEFRGGPRGKGASLRGNYFADWFGEVAANGGRSANIHVGGDASHRQIISILEKVDSAKPGSVKGWGMDHCHLINPRDVARAARLGLMFSCNPGVTDGANVAKVFGDEVAHNYLRPIKTLLDAGINVSMEGEGFDRWQGLEALVTRKDREGRIWGPQQRLDRMTALRVATLNGARYVLKESQIGSIENGKLADLVILDRDYLTIPEDEISEMQALATLMGGKFIYLHPAFSQEYNLTPAGAIIHTHEELLSRRKKFPTTTLGSRS